jgi:organic hydroperoxide reductase OsmC/OhrA
MHPYPHRYRVTAAGGVAGNVTVSSPSLPDIPTAPPPEFDGPGGLWSPETLLCAAVANCFILTFRAVSRAARLEWLSLECHVEGTLERVDGKARFTRFATIARLGVPEGSDAAQARTLLEKAEHGCLIANSLNGERTLDAEVRSIPPAPG